MACVYVNGKLDVALDIKLVLVLVKLGFLLVYIPVMGDVGVVNYEISRGVILIAVADSYALKGCYVCGKYQVIMSALPSERRVSAPISAIVCLYSSP